MASSIGIKIANGEFYPVLEEGSTVKKRLVLTTVHDGQRSVQIDLYRSDSRSMADAAYIGSLVVENIADKPKGEPSIELIIGAEGSEELSAEAADLDSPAAGSRQRLSVLLQSMEDGQTYDVPDFELESETTSVPPPGLYVKDEEEVEEISKSEFPLVPVLIGALALLLIAGALIWFFVLNKPAVEAAPKAPATVEKTVVPTPPPAPVPVEPAKSEPAQPAAAAVPPAPAPAAAPTPAAPAPAAAAQPAKTEPAKAEPAKSAPAKAAPSKVEPAKPAAADAVDKKAAAARRVRPDAPVKSYKVPKKIPADGFKYRIRWGDTLWDISEAFYRNPWLYPRIARFNKIRNPDLIISGSNIRIPPKN